MISEYVAPKDIEEALRLMGKWKGKATLIAGGTNVIPDLRAKALKMSALIDLSPIKGLTFIKEEKKRIRIGALTTIAELASSKVIQRCAPILSEAARQLGNPLVRNRATLAGNLADASPAADTAVPLLVLEATVLAERAGKKAREIPLEEFFVAPNRTALKADEIIREIRFAKPGSTDRMAYSKLGLRNAMAISVVSVAVRIEMEGVECKKARVALGAVAPKPIRAYRCEDILRGGEITPELIEVCSGRAEEEVKPITDIRATADYRKSMCGILLRRTIERAFMGRR